MYGMWHFLICTSMACTSMGYLLLPAPNSAEAAANTLDEATASRSDQIRRLEPLSVLVGSWRGVGQPTRGSNAGSWSEKTAAAWDFKAGKVQLVLTADGGKQFHQLRFAPLKEDGQIQLTVRDADETERTLICPKTAENGSLVFESPAESLPALRCTVRPISQIRVTVLFEQRTTPNGSFRRIAEVGYTREGERLAKGNTGERQCIVTGGLGTISVRHEGRTYYVCCEGCQQAFDADPQGTIDAYRERLKTESEPKKPGNECAICVGADTTSGAN